MSQEELDKWNKLRELDEQCFEKLKDLLGLDLQHADISEFVREVRPLVIEREAVRNSITGGAE